MYVKPAGKPGTLPCTPKLHLPQLPNVDRPRAADLPRFVDNLGAAIDRSLGRPLLVTAKLPAIVEPFTWDAIFARVEPIWRDTMGIAAADGRRG